MGINSFQHIDSTGMYSKLIRHVVIKSATPQLSKKVLSLTDENRSLESARISLKPILIIAAYTYTEQEG